LPLTFIQFNEGASFLLHIKYKEGSTSYYLLLLMGWIKIAAIIECALGVYFIPPTIIM
jgi:hypothetical protein